jgi:hypothetical protein
MGSGIFIAHYLNDRSSLEFQGPLLDGGPEYYGLMWLLFELLGDAPEHRLPSTQLKGIAHQCFSTPEKITAFIASAVEAELFQEEGGWFWCDELNRRIGHSLDAMPLKKRKPSERIIDGVKRGKEKEYPEDFESFWMAYPRKEGKVKAYEQYMINLKNGCSESDMMASARNYARNREGGDAQYTLMPSTFLGPSQRWIEYVKEKETKASSVAERPRRTACPVCGKELGMGIINTCLKCGFWLDDGDDPRKVESYRQDYERGGVVPFDAKKLIAELAQRATAKRVRQIAAEGVMHGR